MRIMRDAMGSQNLIPGHKSYILRVQVLLLRILSFIDHFADFIITNITAGLKNCMFTEIAPRTFYPLYGIIYGYIV